MAQHIARVIIVVVIFTITAFAWKRYASASCAALVFPVGWTGFLILFFRTRLKFDCGIYSHREVKRQLKPPVDHTGATMTEQAGVKADRG